MKREIRSPRRSLLLRFAPILLAAAIAPATDASPAGDSGAFVMTVGRDTIGLERFSRTAGGAEATLVFRPVGVRLDFSVAILPDGSVQHMESAARSASAAPGSEPMQRAKLEWRADSVIADVTPGGIQRLASEPGSMPYVNPSIFLLELIVKRAGASSPPMSSVPVFAVSGGRTIPATLRFAGRDSLVLALGAAEFQLRIDGQGHILSGAVAAQGVRFERVEALPRELLAAAPADYSAPPGAPFRAETVRVPTRGGFELVGTLTRPNAPGRAPAVVAITGSGPQDRDETIPMVKGYRPFRQIADTLARRGIAVLRLDDRGSGESGGRFAGSTSADFADDIEDALRWLGRDAGIDSTRLALMGHSEGGLIAPLVAQRGPTVRALALLAAPAWNGRRILEYQQDFDARKRLSGAAVDSALAAGRRNVDSLATADPWIGFFVAHDPLAVARKLSRPPVLILQGGTDRQVTPEQAGELAAAFRAAGNRDVTLRVLPATNHLFLPDTSGDPAGYASLGSRAVPSATLGLIADWLASRLLPPPGRRR